jgi:hypothetical protein
MDFAYVNNNAYMAGFSLLMLNVGSRYIMADIGGFLEKVLAHDLVKKLVLFCMFFVATRNAVTSLVLTVVFSIIIYGFFNEKSRYSLIPNDDLIKRQLSQYYTLM